MINGYVTDAMEPSDSQHWNVGSSKWCLVMLRTQCVCVCVCVCVEKGDYVVVFRNSKTGGLDRISKQ